MDLMEVSLGMFYVTRRCCLLRNANLKFPGLWLRAFRNPVSSCRGAKIQFVRDLQLYFLNYYNDGVFCKITLLR